MHESLQTAHGAGNLIEALRQLNAGDNGARNQVMTFAWQRFCDLMAKIVRESFPKLKAKEESLCQQATISLLGALEEVKPQEENHFWSLAAEHCRWRCIDEVRRQSRECGSYLCETETTFDPVKLAEWREFHEQVERLPHDEGQVFCLCFYKGYTRAEVAEILAIHPKAASRLWVAATERLLDALPGIAD